MDPYDPPGVGDVVPPPASDWNDVIPSETNTKFTIDEAKERQWKLAKAEIKHITDSIAKLIQKDAANITFADIVNHVVGLESEFARIFKESLKVSDTVYLQFMATAMMQSAYKQSPSQMYQRSNVLSGHLIMKQSEYIEVWRSIAKKEKMSKNNFVGDGRRQVYLFEKLESSFNSLCNQISITQRTGTISIALDDDKFWAFQSKANLFDTFGLKYQQHVQANRKGFVAHTAVSTGLYIPIGIIFERLKDSSISCFKRLLSTQFCRTGGDEPNLSNVEVASPDCRYMLPN